jgi:hypothetical protein
MPQHYIASIFLTSKRLQKREGIQLNRQSYSRFSPKNKRERNGVESITRLDRCKEAIPLQSVFKSAQSSINMILSSKSWVTPWTICLNISVWHILHHATKENFSMTLVSWGTQNASNKSSREYMSTHPTQTCG